MFSRRSKGILTMSAFALCAVIASLVYAHFSDLASLPLTVLADIVLLLIVTMALMATALRSNLEKTLYSYSNIVLIGLLIFTAVFAVVFGSYYIRIFTSGAPTVRDIFRTLLGFPRQFSFYALFVFIAICLLVGVSNVQLMRKEGVHLHNALSLLMAVFFIGGTLLVYLTSDLLSRYQSSAASPSSVLLTTVLTTFMLLCVCYLECVFLGSAILGFKAARTVPRYDKDYIIILGCSIDKRGGLLPLLKGRVNRAIRFAWEQEIATGKPLKYVPSGGQGPNEVMSEGSAMGLYLLTRGAEEYEVFPEKKSTNTLENLQFSKAIIDELKPDAKIAFATTNYHILRAGILAREAGFDAEGIAGDTKWYFWPNGFIREFFGILVLKKKAHLTVAAVLAVLCTAVGLVGYFGGLL